MSRPGPAHRCVPFEEREIGTCTREDTETSAPIRAWYCHCGKPVNPPKRD